MSGNVYQEDRGNKDHSIAKPDTGSTSEPVEKGGRAVKTDGAGPFLIGEAMTGGYGAADILFGCTVAA